MLRRYAAVMLAAAIAFCSFMTGCDNYDSLYGDLENIETGDRPYKLEELGFSFKGTDDKEHKAGYQLEKPEAGEEIAVIKTSMGDITMRFFPEAAPKAVENFKTLAKSGYYDNCLFYRVYSDGFIQTGDPTANGEGGDSSFGEPFEDEFTNKLLNIRGAVSMSNYNEDSNTSQFFINQKKKVDFDEYRDNWEYVYQRACQMKDMGILEKTMPAWKHSYYSNFYDIERVEQDVIDLYEKYGGNPEYDGYYNALKRGNTVFAQVIDGMDVVDKIADAEIEKTEGQPDDYVNRFRRMPKEDIIIKSIEFKTYK